MQRRERLELRSLGHSLLLQPSGPHARNSWDECSAEASEAWSNAIVLRGRLWALVLLGALMGCTANPSPTLVSPTSTMLPHTVTREASPTLDTPLASETPTPASTSTVAAVRRATRPAKDQEEQARVTFTVVYDNNAWAGDEKGLQTSWGFACWVQTEQMTVLFDTGGDGAVLTQNLARLDLDPLDIDAVVLSHTHGDHTGGLSALLSEGTRPTVYLTAAFSSSFKEGLREQTGLVDGVSEPRRIGPGLYTTGDVGRGIVEQALIVETEEGLVVVTGCAHPGVVSIVRRAAESLDDQVALLMGGFHLRGAGASEVGRVIAELQELGVAKVAPCHCTGDAARQMFDEAFGEDCVLAGVGWSTELELSPAR